MNIKWHETKQLPVVKDVVETGDHTLVEQDTLPFTLTDEEVDKLLEALTKQD